MINTKIRFDNNSARLEIEGLPDYSLGHEYGTIGILSSWQLQLIGGTTFRLVTSRTRPKSIGQSNDELILDDAPVVPSPDLE